MSQRQNKRVRTYIRIIIHVQTGQFICIIQEYTRTKTRKNNKKNSSSLVLSLPCCSLPACPVSHLEKLELGRSFGSHLGLKNRNNIQRQSIANKSRRGVATGVDLLIFNIPNRGQGDSTTNRASTTHTIRHTHHPRGCFVSPAPREPAACIYACLAKPISGR